MIENAPSRSSPAIDRWRAEFVDPEIERAFRADHFQRSRAQNRAVGLIVGVFLVIYVASDYWLLGLSAKFYELLALRVGFAAFAIWAMVPYRPAAAFAAGERRVFLVQLGMPLVYFYIASQMPAEHIRERSTLPSVLAALYVVSQYMFFVNRFAYQVAAGLFTTASYVVMSLAVGRMAPLALTLEVLLHVLAHLGGILVAYRAARMARRQFALFAEEKRLSAALAERGHDLERARDRALHATRAKSEFLAHMSHELRTPLNAIMGFADVMKREMFGPLGAGRYRDYAGDIHSSAAHLNALIDDVLDLSRAEAGKLAPAPAPVDLAATFDAVRRLVALRADVGGVALEFSAPPLPALAADPRMVKQMLLNLVTNALKFTGAGGRVRVSAATRDDGGVALAVTDTGEGLDPEDIPRVLEPYGRSDVARLGAKEGTGLGLPLVKAMIEAHGGRVEIASARGKGSAFTLIFPPAAAAAPARAPAAAAPA